MAERIYYVISKDNCQFEGLTKEQVFAAIAEATGNTPTKVDEAFITKIKEQNKNTNLKIWVGTASEFNALTEKDADTLYVYPDTTLEDVEDTLQKVLNGTTPVAEASHAANADNATSATTALSAGSATKATNAEKTDFTNSEWSDQVKNVKVASLVVGATYQIVAYRGTYPASIAFQGFITYHAADENLKLIAQNNATLYVNATGSGIVTVTAEIYYDADSQGLVVAYKSIPTSGSITSESLSFRYRRIK